MNDSRIFRDGVDGTTYRVSIHPHGLAAGKGISPWLNTLVFEELATGRVLSAPVYNAWELGELTDRDLKLLLERGAR